MPTITLADDATIWYQRVGDGEPLLHIHGSAFGHRNFERLTPLLAEHYEVIDFDLPGYGLSHGGPSGQDFDGFAAQVAAFVKELGLEKVHLHGTSFGAMIGLTVAARYPQLIDGLVLSCFLARYDRAARVMRGTWKRAARESGMDAVADLTSVAGFARSFYEREDADAQLESMRTAFRHTTPEAFIASTETIEHADLSPLVSDVSAPTLLLAGAEDNMTPFAPADSGIGMQQMASLLPSCAVQVVPLSGHYLVIEAASGVAARIHDFLGGRSG